MKLVRAAAAASASAPPKYLTVLRHFSTEPNLPPTRPPPLSAPSSLASQVVDLLQSSDDDWSTNDRLNQLLFTSPASLSPYSLLQITRRLGTSAKALRFCDYIRANSPSPSPLSSAFQAVFELASRECQSESSSSRLYDLFNFARDYSIPLTVNSAILLIRCFARSRNVERSLLVYNELDAQSQNVNVRNVVLDVLWRSGREEDALKLLDEMLERETNCPPNHSTLNVIMTAVSRRECVGRNVSDDKIVDFVVKFGEHGVFPDAFWITQLISRLCKTSSTDKAWNLLHDLMRLRGDVEAVSFNALLTGLSRQHDFNRMNLLLNEMKEKEIQPNVVTFGILINHMCKERRVDDALEVFQKMSEEDNGLRVTPDVILYNTLIDGLCKVGRQEEGLTLMKEMSSKHGYKPNAATYNCLIDGFCKAGEIDMSHKLFDQMNDEGVRPNVITMNTLVDGMCKHGRTNSALEFFRNMQSNGLKGNVVTYTAFINAFCHVNNISMAKKLFDNMLSEGCSPDAVVYYTLISGLSLAGKLDDAHHVASMMKQAGFCLDVVCYNVLIGGFCRKKKMDKAFEMLKDMEQSGVKPDSVTYNTLISHFSEMGNFTTAHEIMRRMISDGLVPTVVTYGALIHAYCLVDQLDEAMEIFRAMCSSSRVSPNTVIYNTLIHSLCKSKKVVVALELMDDMRDRGVRPNTTTYNAIFGGLKEINCLEKAFTLMDQMTEHACNPDYITMETLTEWLSAVGEIQKLQSFLQGYPVSTSTAQFSLEER